MAATNDTINNSTQYAVPHGTVDGNSPVERSKKAVRLDMSVKHRFGTDYDIDSVMCGKRGDERHGQTGTMNGRMQVSMSETGKKNTAFVHMPTASIGTHSTPSY
jgi:hypothetical protein